MTDLSNEFYPVPKNIKMKMKKQKQKHIKQKSNKLAELENKRFSILTEDMGHCYICTRKGNKNIPRQDLHEVYGGSNRQRSMMNGLVVPLCRKCHTDTEILEWLKKHTQSEYEKKHTREEFIGLIGKSYM